MTFYRSPTPSAKGLLLRGPSTTSFQGDYVESPNSTAAAGRQQSGRVAISSTVKSMAAVGRGGIVLLPSLEPMPGRGTFPHCPVVQSLDQADNEKNCPVLRATIAACQSNPELSEYGGARFVAAVRKARTWGIQFHPEKSSGPGLRILANFVAEAGGST